MKTLRITWTITFYSEKVEEKTLELPPGILASFLRITELIEEFGPNPGRPHTAPLGQGLFEIRAKGREGIARSVFCTAKGEVCDSDDSGEKGQQAAQAPDGDGAQTNERGTG